jgi:hypothetical protein
MGSPLNAYKDVDQLSWGFCKTLVKFSQYTVIMNFVTLKLTNLEGGKKGFVKNFRF